MSTTKKLFPFTLCFCLLTPVVHAQSYSIDWDVIANGGGLTSGGGYSANTTIGEHVAGGSLSGGTYSLASGFWALYAVTTPGAPVLTIQILQTNSVVLAWPASSTSWTLQQTTNLASGTWVALTNTVNSISGQNQVILPPLGGNRFYRLQGH
jgi:hypothetical protein